MEGSHQGRPSEEVLYDQSDLSEPEEIPDARSGRLERVPLCQTGLQEQVAFEEAPHVGSDLLKRALLCQTDLLEPERLCQTDLLLGVRLICRFDQLEQGFHAHFDRPSQEEMRTVCSGLPLEVEKAQPSYFDLPSQEAVSLIFG